MRKIKKLIAILLSIGIMGGSAGCGLIAKTPEGIAATVIAKINDQKITRGEFDKKFNSYLEQMKLYYGEDAIKQAVADAEQLKGLKSDFLDGMVQETIMIQKGKELNIIGDEKAINDEIDKKYNETVKLYEGEENFKKELEKAKITVEEYKESIKTNVILTKVQESIVKDVTATDDEINKYYNENKYSFTEKPNKMDISHILVKTEKEAKEIKERIEKGEKFEDLAKELSTDPGSKEEGGALGEFEYANNQLDQKFFINAITVPVGQLSAPFETQFGWHIVRMNKKEEYNVKSLETVKEEIKEIVIDSNKDTKMETTLKEWNDKSKIKTYPEKL